MALTYREERKARKEKMRMRMQRFTRLTNGFSKKVENLEHAVALRCMHCNFCLIHQSLRVTLAMEAGIAAHVWSLEEVVGLLACFSVKSGSAFLRQASWLPAPQLFGL